MYMTAEILVSSFPAFSEGGPGLTSPPFLARARSRPFRWRSGGRVQSCQRGLLPTLSLLLLPSRVWDEMSVAAALASEDAIAIERLSDRPPQPAAAPARPLNDDDDDDAPPRKATRSSRFARFRPTWRFTLAGRALALLAGELAANAAIWIVAGIVFGTSEEKRGVLSLCVVAWTLGLRHALGEFLLSPPSALNAQ
jgi:hypothetical protein